PPLVPVQAAPGVIPLREGSPGASPALGRGRRVLLRLGRPPLPVDPGVPVREGTPRPAPLAHRYASVAPPLRLRTSHAGFVPPFPPPALRLDAVRPLAPFYRKPLSAVGIGGRGAGQVGCSPSSPRAAAGSGNPTRGGGEGAGRRCDLELRGHPL